MSQEAIRGLAEKLLATGIGDLPPAERKLLQRVADRHFSSRDINNEFDSQLTFGGKLADRVAEIGGSWSFIIAFAVIIVVWVLLNTVVLIHWTGSFDPYPFVFLNLLLSLIAAIQAPVIMMSQNRQSDKDRLAAQHDYEVNLKAEIEIAALHDKLEQLRTNELQTILSRIESALEDRKGAAPQG
jgi:uncharacterized membrane protein